MTKEREVWIDLVKIIAIFLVVDLHVVCSGVSAGQLNSGLILYYMGTIAIPLFFMASGYIQLRKKEKKITYQYILQKIKKILFVVVIWNIPIFIAKLVIQKQMTNIFYESISNLIQKGYFFQFWYLGAMIVIYLMLPILSRLFEEEKKGKIITGILLGSCVLVDIINIVGHQFGLPIVKEVVIQTFRIWTWLTYFCLGGYIAKQNILAKVPKKTHAILMIAMIIVSILYEYIFVEKFYKDLHAENFYDSIIIIVTTVVVFTFVKKIEFKPNRLINVLGQLTMGIYIIHPTIIKGFNRIFNMTNNWMNLIMLLFIFLISVVCSYGIYKIPKINQLIKL